MYKQISLSLLLLLTLVFFACEDDDNGEDDPTPTAAPDTLKSSYSNSVTLTNDPDLPIDYVGVSDVTFEDGSELIVEPGVVIAFESGVVVTFEDESEVHMNGTESERITLRGIEEMPGYWAGVSHMSSDVTNNWDYVDIMHTGSDEFGPTLDETTTALYLSGDGRLSVQNTQFMDNAGHGLSAFDGTRLPDFQNNHFESNALAPIQISHDGVQYLDNSLTFDNNGESFVDISTDMRELSQENLNGEHTWRFNVLPMHISGIVAGTDDQLTIEPGVHLRANSGDGEFEFDGSLILNGTETDSVRIDHVDEVAGAWNGIILIDDASTYDFNYVSVGYAGGQADYFYQETPANIYVQHEATLNISNSSIHHSGNWGLSYEEGTLNGDAILNETNVNYYANSSGDKTVDDD
ncbi:MAG: hypothetical protein ACOCZ8_07035 [Bacteroidota bacterium]